MKPSLFTLILISVWYPVYNYKSDHSINVLAGEEASKIKESQDSSSRNSAQSRYCRKSATCEKLKNSTCYGVRLPYTSTSLDLSLIHI